MIRELGSVTIITRPDWKGDTIVTDKRYIVDKKAQFKYELKVPVVTNEEEAQKELGISFDQVLRIAAKQIWYSAANVDNVIREAQEKAIMPDDEELVLRIEAAAQTQTFEKTAAIRKTGEVKEFKAAKSEILGMGFGSVAEAMAALRELQAAKG